MTVDDLAPLVHARLSDRGPPGRSSGSRPAEPAAQPP